MPKNDNAHLMRMYNSLCENADQQSADKFAEKFPLSKSAPIERKFKWSEDACAFLEENFDEKTICKIRSACYCDEGITKAEKMKHILARSSSFAEFANKYNEVETAASIETDGKNLFFIFPTCYCSHVKRINKPISKTWCYCSLGFAYSLFFKVFDSDIKVELLESIKTGGNRCVFKVSNINHELSL